MTIKCNFAGYLCVRMCVCVPPMFDPGEGEWQRGPDVARQQAGPRGRS